MFVSWKIYSLWVGRYILHGCVCVCLYVYSYTYDYVNKLVCAPVLVCTLCVISAKHCSMPSELQINTGFNLLTSTKDTNPKANSWEQKFPALWYFFFLLLPVDYSASAISLIDYRSTEVNPQAPNLDLCIKKP